MISVGVATRHPDVATRGTSRRCFQNRQRVAWAGWMLGLAALVLASACATPKAAKPAKLQFYKNLYVRSCLESNQEKKTSETQGCWQQLLQRVESDPEFVTEQKFTPSDLAKIRQMAGNSDERAAKLRRELDVCFNLPSSKRDERERCFVDYRDKHGSELSVSERYEIDNAISAQKEAKERAAGNIEATMEHAGKLLGARLLQEDQGIRVDALVGGPLQQAQVREQGLVVLINESPVSTLDPAEQVARLESCQEKPVILLVRYGGKEQVTYDQIEARCEQPASGKRLSQVVIPVETCSEVGSPEIRLGIGWCYQGEEGVLAVQEVCADSPAAQAGVQPGQEFVAINGVLLLGKPIAQLGQWIEAYPAKPLSFQSKAGVLDSPAALTLPPLSKEKAEVCAKAVHSRLGE